MTKAFSVRLKAGFLLFIFSSNIVVGFACAIGMDMGFNTRHHHEEGATEIHDHADSNKQHHEAEAIEIHDHTDSNKHHHEVEETELPDHVDNNKHHHKDAEYEFSPNGGKDDCCNDKVLMISQTDKAVSQITNLTNAIFFTAFISVSYHFAGPYLSPLNTSKKYFYYGHHPPIPDIRIAIRSFQI